MMSHAIGSVSMRSARYMRRPLLQSQELFTSLGKDYTGCAIIKTLMCPIGNGCGGLYNTANIRQSWKSPRQPIVFA